MRKRVGTLTTLVITLALLSLLATVTVAPTLAYDPDTDELSAYSHTQIPAEHTDDPAHGTHKKSPAANHPNEGKALVAQSTAGPQGGNKAHGKIKVWKDPNTGQVDSKGGVKVSGDNADAEVGWDPAGGLVWLRLPEVLKLDSRGGKARVEIRATDDTGELVYYWAELSPAGLSASPNWLAHWTVKTTLGRKLAEHGPFAVLYTTVGATEMSIKGRVSEGTAMVQTLWIGVGGVAFLPNKLELLAPWIILGLAIPVSIVSIGIYKKKRRA